MNKPKISIIVPVYNTAQYLCRCLDSIINQTLKEIEIICINDCSTDNSSQILQDYSGQDTRMQIINNERNFGETYSKNRGIKNAKGDYIGFVDSDDTVNTNFYEKLYVKAFATNAEIVKANRVQIDNLGNKTNEFINDRVRKNKLYFSFQHTTAIYSRSLLLSNNIDFPEGITNSGDIVFLVKAVCSCNTIETVDDVYYNYFRRGDSMNSVVLNIEKLQSLISSGVFIIDYINKINMSIEDYLIVFSNHFISLLSLPERVAIENRYYACRSVAACLMDLYVKCKYKDEFTANKRYLSKYLAINDFDGLVDYCKKSRKEQRIDDFRENVKVKLGVINIKIHSCGV